LRPGVKLAKRRREWPRFAPPQQRGAITISDVLAAPAGEPRDDMIRQWRASVWVAWAENHAHVKALLREALSSSTGRAQ